MFGIFSNVLKFAGRTLQPAVNLRQFHAIPTCIGSNEIVQPSIANVWSLSFVRTKIRDYFPKPSEYKRLKKHGWRVRLKTKGGRRLLMNRILKGRYYYAH